MSEKDIEEYESEEEFRKDVIPWSDTEVAFEVLREIINLEEESITESEVAEKIEDRFEDTDEGYFFLFCKSVIVRLEEGGFLEYIEDEEHDEDEG